MDGALGVVVYRWVVGDVLQFAEVCDRIAHEFFLADETRVRKSDLRLRSCVAGQGPNRRLPQPSLAILPSLQSYSSVGSLSHGPKDGDLE